MRDRYNGVTETPIEERTFARLANRLSGEPVLKIGAHFGEFGRGLPNHTRHAHDLERHPWADKR
jgi:hypothetical protein